MLVDIKGAAIGLLVKYLIDISEQKALKDILFFNTSVMKSQPISSLLQVTVVEKHIPCSSAVSE